MAPWLKNLPSSAADSVSTPNGGTEILHVMGRSSPQLLSPSPTAEAPPQPEEINKLLCVPEEAKVGTGKSGPCSSGPGKGGE